jgi:DNA-binding NtrC family response regulator
LRERPDDLPELVSFFLARAAEAANRPRPVVSAAALDRLRAYHWPGNVRELQNVIFRAFGVCRGPQILPEHLDFAAGAAAGPPAATGEDAALAGIRAAIDWAWESGQTPLAESLHQLLERELVKAALVRLGGNKTKVAEQLGISRNKVNDVIQTHGLK